MKEVTPKQQKVLQALERTPYALAADIAKELGVHITTVTQHLKALERKGHVHYRSRGRGRPAVIERIMPRSGVPLIGEIPAGPLSEALEHPEGLLPLEERPGRFALRVHGDSMADLMQSGDVVLLDKNARPRPGEICALRVDGSDVTLKYLDWSGGRPSAYTLRPHNPDFPTLEVSARDLVVEGVYRGLIRGDFVGELLLDAN